MQTWSKTFNESKAKTVLFLWSLLLLMDTVCALLTEAYRSDVGFPQLRFCPLGSNDTLPITNSGPDTPIITWNLGDIYQANRTVANYFTNATAGPVSHCIYSCFAFVSSIRDPTDIAAQQLNFKKSFWVFLQLTSSLSSPVFNLAYVLIGLAGFSSLIVLFMEKSQHLSTGSEPYNCIVWNLIRDTRLHVVYSVAIALSRIWDMAITLLTVYGKFVLPFIVFILTCLAEWVLWTEKKEETFRHFGQWGSLVAVGLVFVVAIVDHLASKFNGDEEDTSKNDAAIEMTGIAGLGGGEHAESQDRLIRSSPTGVDQSA